MSNTIKVAGGLVLVAAVVLSQGCMPQVAEAGFPRRPDTVEPGDLLGPFDGRAVDASTGKPISGATVYAAWTFELGRGLQSPDGGASETTATDADGHYFLPRLAELPGSRARIARVVVIIYKSGFIAWRSDRRFEDLSVRHDFSQRNNLAKLDRYPAGLSHARHVRFVGGSGALRRAMAGEIMLASLELSGSAAPAPTSVTAGPPLDAAALLSEAELKAVTGFDGTFTLGPLTDLPPSQTYGSQHFDAVDKPESYDAAIRVWRPATPELADERFETLMKEVPHAARHDVIGDRSLTGYDGQILAAATEDRARHLVIELTCGVDQCRDVAQTEKLLKLVLSRADRLDQPPPAPEKPPAPPPKPDEMQQFQLRPPELKRR